MKKNKIYYVTLLLLLSFSAMSMTSAKDIPVKIQEYLQVHFQNKQVVKYKSEWKPTKTKHKVYLIDQTKVEFDKNFNAIEVESKNGIPASILPSNVSNYIQKNYPNRQIKEWEMKRTKQEVKLMDGLELEFDVQGNFLRIDD